MFSNNFIIFIKDFYDFGKVRSNYFHQLLINTDYIIHPFLILFISKSICLIFIDG
jgi:hypothetical protein